MGDIIKRFEQKGFKLVAMKFMQVGKNDSIRLSGVLGRMMVG